MNGLITLESVLSADSALVSLLSTYGGNPCIGLGTKEPDEWPKDGSCVTIYQSGIVDNGRDSLSNTATVSCRAMTEAEAEALAGAVVDACNRSGNNDYWLNCQTFGIIQPSNDVDAYNVPVEVTIKGVRTLV